MRKILLISFLFYFTQYSFSQTWIRIYGDSIATYCFKVSEYYDHGYLFTGEKFTQFNRKFGLILKTDINGNELWEHLFGDTVSSSPLFGMDKTNNGIITIGQTSSSSLNWSAHVIKINACGEKEWCRIYHTPGRQVYGLDIQSIPGGGSIAMVGNWGYDYSKTLWLFRLDDNGDIIWQQAFAYDSVFYDPEGQQLFRTTDTTFIITGYVYAPDSGQTNPYKNRPLLIKVKLEGTSLFQLAWGTNNGNRGYGYVSETDINGTIYSGIKQARFIPPYGEGPSLISTSKDGFPFFSHILIDTSSIGGAGTINWFQDSTLVLGLAWKDVDLPTGKFFMGVMKTDKFGNKLKYKNLIPYTNYGYPFNDADITYDNKVIIINSCSFTSNWQTWAFKLNYELEYDSIYTLPFTYDSLCPHPIVSDKIPLNDCDMVVVGVDDPVNNPETVQLHIYPNPAKNEITIEMPQYIIRQSSGYGVTATTYYHKWNSITLEIFDLYGKLMYSREIPQKTPKVELDVSSWHSGMYIARVVFMNEVVASQKFIISE